MTLLSTRPAGTPAASTVQALPPGAVTLTSGIWHERQRINREVTIPHGMRCLQDAGNFDNFRQLVEPGEQRHGHLNASDADVKNFVDSDVYKWLEAVGWESIRGPLSSGVEKQVEEIIGLIESAQDPDGYLNTWYQSQDPSARFSNLGFGHELYCLGHLIQAAIAFNRARSDDRLLQVAVRFADLAWRTFGPGGRVAVCGHPEVEMALVELGRETGDQRYIQLAQALVDRRGHGLLGPGRFGTAYYQDRVPFREAATVEGHAVRAVYLGAGAVDVASEVRDAELFQAADRQWSAMVATKMYITGGIGSRHHGESFGDPFELPNDRAYCETCAAIGVAMWSWRLALSHPEGRYLDVMERSLLNGMLVGVSEDGLSFNYDNPLHVRLPRPREAWFEIACCPPNVMRTLASIDQYVATDSADGLQIHLYAAADIRGRHGRAISVTTDYPFSGHVSARVAETTGRWTLSLRVPAWTDSLAVEVNGDAVETTTHDGYLALTREWVVGDVVALSLDDRPRLVHPAPTIEAISTQVAVERGPLVYCLESSANEPDLGLSSEVAPRLDEEGDRRDLLVHAAVYRGEEASDWPYSAGPPSPRQVDAGRTVRLRPFFAWGNQGLQTMRVWLPLFQGHARDT